MIQRTPICLLFLNIFSCELLLKDFLSEIVSKPESVNLRSMMNILINNCCLATKGGYLTFPECSLSAYFFTAAELTFQRSWQNTKRKWT